MASRSCMRCLVRPSATAIAIPRRPADIASVAWTAPFSSSAMMAAAKNSAGGNANMSKHIRAGKKMKLGKFKKKRKEGERLRPPAPGERKAFRKRISLSNNNALPVPGLEELTARGMIDPAKAGTVQTLPDALVDQLRASEAFKITQCWGMFRRPSVLIRSETAELSKQMEEYAANNDTLRLVITGEKLTGKSLLLLQAMAYAYLNRWVVINIPEAQELTTAATEYAPIPDTDPVQYSQPNYALKMIQAIRKANEEVLSGLETVHPHPELVQHFPVGTSVLQLANSAKEADTAWAILNALWQELTVEGHGRPPLLLSLDGLPHIMRISDYRSPAYELIHSHDLALVRRFVDHLSGASPLPNGGAVIAATTRNNAPRSPSMELALTQREIEDMARREGEGSTNVFPMPKKDPYGKGYDDRVDAALASVKVLRVRGITKAEARAIIEYWAASGLLRAAVTEATVSEKWTFGGNGILGEMEKASLLTLRM